MDSLASQPILVFLVDDYQTVLWGLANLIKGEYPRMQLIGTASNRSEALSGVVQHRPHVVILDDDLDDESILGFLPNLTALGSHRVLILTSEPYSSELIHQAHASGASGILCKDIPAAQLLHTIECVHYKGCCEHNDDYWSKQMRLI